MSDGTSGKYYRLSARLWEAVVRLKNLPYPCFLLDARFRPGADADIAWYRDLLDNTPGLAQVVTALKDLRMDNGGTGYDAVLRTLINYDPGLDWNSQEGIFSCRIKTGYIFIRTFLVRAVHILWMEKNGQLPWSVRNYSAEEIKGLFFELDINLTGPLRPSLPPGSGFANEWEDFPEPLINLEASYKLHAIAMKLRADTPEQVAINCIRFIKSNFFHPYTNPEGSWMLDRYKGGKPWGTSGDAFCPPDLGRLFEERIAGCHSPAVHLSELLRLLNIPAFPIKMGGHGVTYIPGLNRFVHGDHLVTLPLYPSGILLMTSSEIAGYVTDPILYATADAKIRMVVDPVSAMWLTSAIRRRDTDLTIPFSSPWVPPADVLTLMQQEAPQYHFRLNPAGDGIASDLVPIRSLADFSAPGSGLWH